MKYDPKPSNSGYTKPQAGKSDISDVVKPAAQQYSMFQPKAEYQAIGGGALAMNQNNAMAGYLLQEVGQLLKAYMTLVAMTLGGAGSYKPGKQDGSKTK